MQSPFELDCATEVIRDFVFDSDEDDYLIVENCGPIATSIDDPAPAKQHGGSRPGRSANFDRDTALGHACLVRDYFSNDGTTFDDSKFRRRFRMPRELFVKIVTDIDANDDVMRQKLDATKKPGLTCLQKCTAAIRLLASGASADSLDEYLRIGESTALFYLRRFRSNIVDLYGGEYLRPPTSAEVAHYLDINGKRGWPGLFGSIDCMHWRWKNCPYAGHGEYQDRKGLKSIILEAVATPDLRIWSYFFGMPGSCNDNNVMDLSPFLTDLVAVDSYKADYTINGTTRSKVYFLADGIYPKLSCFVQTIEAPANPKETHFAQRQEATRKDVERCFGVLQARFDIIKQPCRLWDKGSLELIMKTCVILHNLILTYENKNKLAPIVPPPAEARQPSCTG